MLNIRMKQIEKLTLPAIPVELLDSLDQILNLDQFMHGGVGCILKQPNQHLLQWITDMFNCPIRASYVLSGHPLPLGMSPHKDLSGRLYGYHYVLLSGGKQVFTTVYNDNLDVVQQEVLTPHTWYKLPTNEWHSVHGIEPGQTRLSITVTRLDDYPTDSLVGTKFSTQGGYYPGIVPEEWLAARNQEVY